MSGMQKGADAFISNNERDFIIKALREEQRLDGRRPYDYRKLHLQFALDDSSATVVLGQTRVMAVVSAALEAPYPDRPNQGSLRFNVEFSPMASPAFEPGRPGEDAVEVARLVERGLRESRAVDEEALCVLAGRKVWAVRVDVHVLDHDGNLVDACSLAGLAALMAFRRPEVTVGGPDGSDITVHPREVREPVPLSIHHLPIAVTFAFFEDGDALVVDPCLKEEAAAGGRMTVIINAHKEVCAVQKAEGIGLSMSQVMRCMRIAAAKVEEVTAQLRAALETQQVARVQARVRRRQHRPNLAPDPGRAVAILTSDQLPGALAGAALGAAHDEEDLAAVMASSSEASSSGDEGQGEDSGVEREMVDAYAERRPASIPLPCEGQSQPQKQQQQQRLPTADGSANGKMRRRKANGSAGTDAYEGIAASIAGAGGADVPVKDLSAAVKSPAKQKRARKTQT